MFLAGDVGGTKTRLALVKREGNVLVRGACEQFKSANFPNLQEIIRGFLETHQTKVDFACIGVPGPVQRGLVQITNLPWKLSEREIEAACGLKRMQLVNDLYATAAAIPYFTPQDLIQLYSGGDSEERIVSAVIAPGTGLGQAFLVTPPDGAAFQVIASEGGHASFAPIDAVQSELLEFIKQRYGRASVEHVLCGPGLVNIFSFLAESKRFDVSADLSAELENSGDKAAVISKAALQGTSPICTETLQIFLSALGAHAGNMVLSTLATGGVFLGGGIPPKIIPLLENGTFLESFLAKGKLAHVVKATPVYIIKDDYAALTGAAQLAARLDR